MLIPNFDLELGTKHWLDHLWLDIDWCLLHRDWLDGKIASIALLVKAVLPNLRLAIIFHYLLYTLRLFGIFSFALLS